MTRKHDEADERLVRAAEDSIEQMGTVGDQLRSIADELPRRQRDKAEHLRGLARQLDLAIEALHWQIMAGPDRKVLDHLFAWGKLTVVGAVLWTGNGIANGFLEGVGDGALTALRGRAAVAEQTIDRAQTECRRVDASVGVSAPGIGAQVGTPSVEVHNPPNGGTDTEVRDLDVEGSFFDSEVARRVLGLSSAQLQQLMEAGIAHPGNHQYSYDELLELAYAKALWRTLGMDLNAVSLALSGASARELLEHDQPIEYEDGRSYDLSRMKQDLDAAIVEVAG